jgi:hypothetical protein
VDRRASAIAFLAHTGIYIDSDWAMSFFVVRETPVSNRVRYRPDALLNPHIARELFQLLTSGRTQDHREAVEALRVLAIRKPPRDPVVEHKSASVTILASGRRAGKRCGREQLTGDLADQICVWRCAVQRNAAPKSELIRAIRWESRLSVKMIRNHLDSLREYAELLRSHDLLQRAARSLYDGGCQNAEAIAIQTQEDAHEWLASPGV